MIRRSRWHAVAPQRRALHTQVNGPAKQRVDTFGDMLWTPRQGLQCLRNRGYGLSKRMLETVRGINPHKRPSKSDLKPLPGRFGRA